MRAIAGQESKDPNVDAKTIKARVIDGKWMPLWVMIKNECLLVME